MKVEITVPPTGESVTEATVVALLKPTGSFVDKDEEILELETDKVNQILYAPAAGVLTLTVAIDETVKPGQVIGTIETEGAPPPSPPSTPKKEVPPPPPAETKGVRSSPQDYIASLSQPPKEQKAPPPPLAPVVEGQTRKKMSSLRRTIAKKLVAVKNQTAMLTTFNEVDMSAILEIRSREKERFLKKHDIKLGLMSFFFKASCAALKEFPELNA